MEKGGKRPESIVAIVAPDLTGRPLTEHPDRADRPTMGLFHRRNVPIASLTMVQYTYPGCVACVPTFQSNEGFFHLPQTKASSQRRTAESVEALLRGCRIGELFPVKGVQF